MKKKLAKFQNGSWKIVVVHRRYQLKRSSYAKKMTEFEKGKAVVKTYLSVIPNSHTLTDQEE